MIEDLNIENDEQTLNYIIEPYEKTSEIHQNLDFVNFESRSDVFSAKLDECKNNDKSFYIIRNIDNNDLIGYIIISATAVIIKKEDKYKYRNAIELTTFALDNRYRGKIIEKKIKIEDLGMEKEELLFLKEIAPEEYNKIQSRLEDDIKLSDIIFHHFINEILLKKICRYINFESLVLFSVDIEPVKKIYKRYGFNARKLEQGFIIEDNTKTNNCVFMEYIV